MAEQTLEKRIRKDMEAAMRSGDRLRLDTLRMMISELQKVQANEGELSEDKAVSIIASSAKRRRDCIEAFVNAHRNDLADQERAELEIVMSYLPPQMDEKQVEAEIRNIIEETGAGGPGDLGKVMAMMMARHGSSVDGKQVKGIALHLLGGVR